MFLEVGEGGDELFEFGEGDGPGVEVLVALGEEFAEVVDVDPTEGIVFAAHGGGWKRCEQERRGKGRIDGAKKRKA